MSWPDTSLDHMASFGGVRWRGETTQTGGWLQTWRNIRLAWSSPSSSEVPSAENTSQRITVLKKKNIIWAKQKEVSYFSHYKGVCFTVLLKWLSAEVKDSSFVKLPINLTVFRDLLNGSAKAQRHAFSAPIPFTYHHNTVSKSKLLWAAVRQKQRHQSKEQPPWQNLPSRTGFSFKAGRDLTLAVI